MVTAAGFSGGFVRVCDNSTNCDGGFEAEPSVAADGTYAVLVPNGSYRMTFWAPGGSAQVPFPSVVTVNGTNVVADLSVTLRSIKGTVTATGGVPLDGAAAVAYDANNTFVTATYTAADGTYTIWIAPSVYKVQFNAHTLPSIWYLNAPDFTSGTQVNVSAADAVRIDATFPAITISGTISGAAGGGVAATVFVVDASCASPTARGSGQSSSPNGSYAVWVPDSGAYHVYATVPSGSRYYVQGSPSGTVDCAGATTVTVSGQAATGVDVAVPVYRVSGTVRDSAQASIDNAFVSVGANSFDGMYTGPDGTYSLTVYTGDTVTVTVSPPPQYVGAQSSPTLIGTANVTGVDFALASAHLVSGRVVRASDTAPLAFATVTAWTLADVFVTDTVTDGLGQYAMWLADGTYRVSASATGYTMTFWMNAPSFATANNLVISGANVALSDIALP